MKSSGSPMFKKEFFEFDTVCSMMQCEQSEHTNSPESHNRTNSHKICRNAVAASGTVIALYKTAHPVFK
jgi:hypothetical protein